MATPDDIENRLSAVEREVAHLRHQSTLSAADVAAARTLSAGADRDVSEVRSELRAHTSVLHALRETQLEHGARLDQHDVRFDRLEARMEKGFASVDARFASVDARFASVDARFDSIDVRFDSIDARFDSVDVRLASVDRAFATVNAGMAQIVILLEALSERGE